MSEPTASVFPMTTNTSGLDAHDLRRCCGEHFSDPHALGCTEAAGPSLADLVDAYADAKAAEAAAEQRVKDLRDQLLLAYSEILPEDHTLTSGRNAVRVSTSSGWRLDTARLKREQAEVYAAYATPTSSTRLTVEPR
jgi:hypothetical protein